MLEFVLMTTLAPVTHGRTTEIPMSALTREATDRETACYKLGVDLIEAARRLVPRDEKRLEGARVQVNVIRTEHVTGFSFSERVFKIPRLSGVQHRINEFFSGLKPRRFKDLDAPAFSTKDGATLVHVYIFAEFEGPAYVGSEACKVYSAKTLVDDLAEKAGIQKRSFSMTTYFPSGKYEQIKE